MALRPSIPGPSGLRARLRRFAPPALVAAAVAGLYLANGLEFLERQLIDARFQVESRQADQSIVVAAIDSDSMARLGPWPWPRSWHAQVVDTLHDAGARQVIIDIDLSNSASAVEDLALASVLALHGNGTVLAGFVDGTDAGERARADRMPAQAFRRSADTAAVALRPDHDARIRRMPVFDRLADTIIPTLATRLALDATTARGPYYIDYGIDVSGITKISYADILDGAFSPADVAGRSVIIGPTTSQLGTHVPVPRYRLLPATLVHTLAASSLIENRALERPSRLVTLLIAALVAFALWETFRRRGSVRDLAVGTALVCLSSLVVAFVAYRGWPFLLDTTPWMLAAILVLAAGTGERLQAQRQRIASLALDRRKSSRLLTLLFNALEEAVFTTDADGRILTANSAASQMFATSRRSLIGRDLTDLFPPGASTPTAGTDMVRSLVEQKTNSRRIARRADGSGFPVDLNARSYTGTDSTAYLLTVHDISEYEEAEKRRQVVEEQLFDAMESFGEPFAMYSPEDRLLMCNSAFRDLFPGRRDIVRPGATFDTLMGAAVDLGQMKLTRRQREIWRDERASLIPGGDEKIS
ncbi:MAG: CHASE2 domain-containing protein, partial [Alphaproteobacteria bacterium]|nr:CHASE2 domain-containing protein [Alphaproteobacteria bacterium]